MSDFLKDFNGVSDDTQVTLIFLVIIFFVGI